MRSYILIPALAALSWRATAVAAVASTEIPDVVDSFFPSANSSAPNDSLFESEIMSRQLYRAADWASNPHGNPSFPYSHGAGKRSLQWDEVAKRMEGGDWLLRHGLLSAGSSSRGACTRGKETREGGTSGVAGGDKAHGVCGRRGGKLGKGSKGGAAVEGDPRPAKVQTHVVQSKEVTDEGGMGGGKVKEDPRPAKVQGSKTHVKAGKAEETKGAGIKWGPGPVKIQGSDGDKTGAGETKSQEGDVNVKGSKTGEGTAEGESKSIKEPGRGKCDKVRTIKEKVTSGRAERGACSKGHPSL